MTEFGSDIVYDQDGNVIYDPNNPRGINQPGKGMYNIEDFVTQFDVLPEGLTPSQVPALPESIGQPPTAPPTAPPTTGGGQPPPPPPPPAPPGTAYLDAINKRYMTDYNSYLAGGRDEASWISSPLFQSYESEIIGGIDRLGLEDYDRATKDFAFHSNRAGQTGNPYAASSARIANALQNKLNVFNATITPEYFMAEGGFVNYNKGIKSLT